MKLFDSHAHLDDERFNEDREVLISQIHEEIEGFVSAGYSLEGSKKAVELSKKYEYIYTTCGISPNDIPQTEEELWIMLKEIKNLVKENIENKKIVAIGEIGLDYYWEKDEDKRILQRKAFIEQIKLANEFNLPIVIHTREAVMDTLDILKKNEVYKKGVFHCCPLNRELVKEGLKLGLQEGREKGLQEGKKEIIINLLKENMPLDKISKISGLSINKIKEIQDTL